MALGLTQPLTEMSTGIFPGGKDGRRVGLTTLALSCADCLEIWEPQPSGPVQACNGIALPYLQVILGDINQQWLCLHVWHICTDVAMWGTVKGNLFDNNPGKKDSNEDTPKICFQCHHNNL